MSAHRQAANETETVRYSVRVCRWCRRRYVAPIGSRPKGCPSCAPTLFDDAEAHSAPPAA